MSQKIPLYSKFLAECVNYLLGCKSGVRLSQDKFISAVCQRLNFNQELFEFKTIKLNSMIITDDNHYYYQTYIDFALDVLIASGYIVKRKLAAGIRFYISPKVMKSLEDFEVNMISQKALRIIANTAIYNHIDDLVYYSKSGYSVNDISADNVLVRIKNMMKKMYGKDGDSFLQELVSALEQEIDWLINGKDGKKASQTEVAICHMVENSSDYQESLEHQLLDKIKTINPEQFEKLSARMIYELFPKAEVEDALIHNGKSGDMGIDSIVTVQDYLGHPVKYYIQCKRYTANNIGSPDLQNFIGSIAPYSLRQGVFMTTAKFTKAAYQYLDSLEHQYTIKLIDGEGMVNLMIKNQIGVIEKQIKPKLVIDEDFFSKLD